MSKKFSAARRAAFLKAVAETGNQTLAAERAKVSRSWVCLHRSTDPAFDAAVREALAEAQRVLCEHPLPAQPAAESPVSGGPCPAGSRDRRGQSRPETPVKGEGREGNRPPRKWRYHQGEELVVRGTGGSRRAGSDPLARPRLQIRRARVKEWTARTEQRFLNALAACCNIKRACAEVGLSTASQHNHAKRWPAFAAACEQALSIGATRIEAGLLANSAPLWDASEVSPEVPVPAMTAAEAIQLLRLHKKGGAAAPRRRPGRRPRVASAAEVKAALAAQLARLLKESCRDPSGSPQA